MSEITVLIADDQRLLREGLAVLLDLAPDVRVVGQAADGDEAIDLARRLQPRINDGWETDGDFNPTPPSVHPGARRVL